MSANPMPKYMPLNISDLIRHTLNSVKSSKGVPLSFFLSRHCLTSGPQCPAALTHSQQTQHTNQSPFDVPGAFVDVYCYFMYIM